MTRCMAFATDFICSQQMGCRLIQQIKQQSEFVSQPTSSKRDWELGSLSTGETDLQFGGCYHAAAAAATEAHAGAAVAEAYFDFGADDVSVEALVVVAAAVEDAAVVASCWIEHCWFVVIAAVAAAVASCAFGVATLVFEAEEIN